MSESNTNKQAAGGGISASFLLGLTFLVLKLTHMIDWPWIWVTAPFWIPTAFLLTVLVGCGLFVLACMLMVKVLDKST